MSVDLEHAYYNRSKSIIWFFIENYNLELENVLKIYAYKNLLREQKDWFYKGCAEILVLFWCTSYTSLKLLNRGWIQGKENCLYAQLALKQRPSFHVTFQYNFYL